MNLNRLAWGGRVADNELSDLRSAAAALAIALLTLNVIDLWFTNFNIESLGAAEVNGLFAPLIGTPWAVILKVGIPVGIIALAVGVRSVRALSALCGAVGVYMVVVLLGVGQSVYGVA